MPEIAGGSLSSELLHIAVEIDVAEAVSQNPDVRCNSKLSCFT